MHFKESKQMVYGMICREGKGKREMMQFYYKIKNNLKNVIHVCGGLGPVPLIWLAIKLLGTTCAKVTGTTGCQVLDI